MAETSKKRTGRIPLDYYKRPDQFAYWKLGLTIAALVAVGLWASGLGWGAWTPSSWGERSRRIASRGPLARVHATWESQCEACHVPFTPIAGSRWTMPLLGSSKASDARCQSCHAGPPHHESQMPKDLACASCHQDHQGPDKSLVRLADRQCTQCHSDLTIHIRSGFDLTVDPEVTRFDANPDDHPDFRVIRDGDPGRLKFSHARHLAAGMALEDGGPVQTLEMLAGPDQARYRRYADPKTGAIRLDCAACHRLDAEDTGSPVVWGAPRSAGAYMLPIAYENQCRACHPLDYDPSAPSLVMQHDLQPRQVRERLWETYASQVISKTPRLLEQRIPPRPLPGQAEAPEARQAREAVERKVQNAEKLLFGAKKCGECHHYETRDRRPALAFEHWDAKSDVRVTATNVPEIWLRRATFNHSAHRAVSCRGCHPHAYADDPQASKTGEDLLLPTVKVCLECHGPKRTSGESRQPTGGAGYGCTECHRYHNGDAPLQGPGAASRDAALEATIREFLHGKAKAAPAHL